MLTGLLVGASATLANLLLAAIARALFYVPTTFRPLMPLPILAASLGGALGAAGLFGLLERTSSHPRRSLTLAAIAALLISFLLPARLIEPIAPSSSSVGFDVFLALLIMHIIVAWLSVRALQRLRTKYT